MKTESVFEKYAREYDILTNARAREKYHRREVAALMEQFHPKVVLDAGCATGLTSLLFARRGVKAVGLDRSRKMIAEARKKHGRSGLPLKFSYGHFEKLPRSMNGRFDLVVCLANAVAGLSTPANLRRGLAGFRRVLRPGGILVLQALNLASIKEELIFPVRATQQGRIGYLRFARRRGNRQELTVVRLDLSTRPLQFEVFAHETDSFEPRQLEAAMAQAGFSRLKRYGDLMLSGPFRKSSRDIVLVGQRPPS